MRISDLDENDTFKEVSFEYLKANPIGNFGDRSVKVVSQNLNCAHASLKSVEIYNAFMEKGQMLKVCDIHSFDDISNDIVDGKCGDALEKTIENAKEKTDQLFNDAKNKGVDYIDNTGPIYPGTIPE